MSKLWPETSACDSGLVETIVPDEAYDLYLPTAAFPLYNDTPAVDAKSLFKFTEFMVAFVILISICSKGAPLMLENHSGEFILWGGFLV